MKSFEYIIRDELGIHARPAGLLAKKAKEYDCEITVTRDGKSVSATKLMALMSLGVKYGDLVKIEIDGRDEEKACAELKDFFEENF